MELFCHYDHVLFSCRLKRFLTSMVPVSALTKNVWMFSNSVVAAAYLDSSTIFLQPLYPLVQLDPQLFLDHLSLCTRFMAAMAYKTTGYPSRTP